MDLQTLRINRTPVSQNPKCEGCAHYDGNAAAKGGACEVGQMPQVCGNGADPKYGYAPLAELSPDEVDDLATPLVTGPSGTMNEHGTMEQTIVMQRVCLGDEDLTMAQRIHGKLLENMQKSIAYSQGQINRHSGAELGVSQVGRNDNVMVDVAKALHDRHLSPRERHKYGVSDVLQFLATKGMPVSDDDTELCKSRFGPTRELQPQRAKPATPTPHESAQELENPSRVPRHSEAMTHMEHHMGTTLQSQNLAKPASISKPYTTLVNDHVGLRPAPTKRSQKITRPIPIVKSSSDLQIAKPSLAAKVKDKFNRPRTDIDEYGNSTKPNAVVPQAKLLKKDIWHKDQVQMNASAPKKMEGKNTSVPSDQTIGETSSGKKVHVSLDSYAGKLSSFSPKDHEEAASMHKHAFVDSRAGKPQGTDRMYNRATYQPEKYHQVGDSNHTPSAMHKKAYEAHTRAANEATLPNARVVKKPKGW